MDNSAVPPIDSGTFCPERPTNMMPQREANLHRFHFLSPLRKENKGEWGCGRERSSSFSAQAPQKMTYCQSCNFGIIEEMQSKRTMSLWMYIGDFILFFFLNPHLRICLLILEKEEGRETSTSSTCAWTGALTQNIFV